MHTCSLLIIAIGYQQEMYMYIDVATIHHEGIVTVLRMESSVVRAATAVTARTTSSTLRTGRRLSRCVGVL